VKGGERTGKAGEDRRRRFDGNDEAFPLSLRNSHVRSLTQDREEKDGSFDIGGGWPATKLKYINGLGVKVEPNGISDCHQKRAGVAADMAHGGKTWTAVGCRGQLLSSVLPFFRCHHETHLLPKVHFALSSGNPSWFGSGSRSDHRLHPKGRKSAASQSSTRRQSLLSSQDIRVPSSHHPQVPLCLRALYAPPPSASASVTRRLHVVAHAFTVISLVLLSEASRRHQTATIHI
jgi:hypothetical protein